MHVSPLPRVAGDERQATNELLHDSRVVAIAGVAEAFGDAVFVDFPLAFGFGGVHKEARKDASLTRPLRAVLVDPVPGHVRASDAERLSSQESYDDRGREMSTLAYATLTTRREAAPPGTSTSQSPPGVKSYVDATAALVPAEVLTLHAVILSITTKTHQGTTGNSITEITEPQTLSWAFFGLLVLGVVLYAVPRVRTWERLDFVRMLIPPIAFVAWTMLQKATAFDAVCPQLREVPRTVIALFVAVLLGLAAVLLAYRADRHPPRTGK